MVAAVLAMIIACGKPTAEDVKDCQARGGHMQQTGTGWACVPNGMNWQ